MEPNKISMEVNLSSQANMRSSRNSTLSQFNLVVVLGSRLAGLCERTDRNVGVCMKIKKTGEIEIDGLPVQDLKDPNIKVYSGMKKTVSDDCKCGTVQDNCEVQHDNNSDSNDYPVDDRSNNGDGYDNTNMMLNSFSGGEMDG